MREGAAGATATPRKHGAGGQAEGGRGRRSGVYRVLIPRLSEEARGPEGEGC